MSLRAILPPTPGFRLPSSLISLKQTIIVNHSPSCSSLILSYLANELLGMMVMYWIHQPVFSSQREHTTCWHPTLNNLCQRSMMCVFLRRGMQSQFSFILSGKFILCFSWGAKVWHLSWTTLPFCITNYQPRSKGFRG